MKRALPWILVGISLLITVLSLAMSSNSTKPKTAEAPTPQTNEKKYAFLTSSLDLDTEDDTIINFIPLRTDLTNYIATSSGDVSMYFEYIPNGISIGINEKSSYLYASLLKVPMAMALFQKINRGESKLSDMLTIQDSDIDKQFGTLWEKGIGTKVTVADTLQYMLSNSDNTAYQMIRRIIHDDDFFSVFAFLDIPLDDKKNPTVTPKNYTSVLKSLYHASVLPPEDSEYILNLLAHSSFDLGIRASLPEVIPIAHKWGISQQTGVFSDCGIVYYPRRPYYLCIMQKTPGKTDITALRTISDKIYSYIKAK